MRQKYLGSSKEKLMAIVANQKVSKSQKVFDNLFKKSIFQNMSKLKFALNSYENIMNEFWGTFYIYISMLEM